MAWFGKRGWVSAVAYGTLGLAACAVDDPAYLAYDVAVEVEPDAADPCEGKAWCPIQGSDCDGDRIVTCAVDVDGCLVETTEDCSSRGETCDDTGAAATCRAIVDPCQGVSNCADAGSRRCDGADLVECAADTQGCLVESVTDCGELMGGVCDASGAMAMCGVDPCADVTSPCSAEGTSCEGTELTVCAPDEYGCLVETVVDCDADMTGDTCGDVMGQSLCIPIGGNVCEGVDPSERCGVVGTTCNGPLLESCAPNPRGCLVTTATDCAAVPNGVCDVITSACDVLVIDPCDGVTQCPSAGRRCDMNALAVCAPDPMGCLVEAVTDCGANGDVCDDTGVMVTCRRPCTDECAVDGEALCAGGTLSVCEDNDMDGCLDLTTTDCLANGTYCDGAAAPAMCVAQGDGDSCAAPIVMQTPTLRISGTNWSADFGDNQDFAGGSGCTYAQTGASELVVRVDLTAGQQVRVVETGALDSVRRILSGAGGCLDDIQCYDSIDSESADVSYIASMDETVYVVVDSYFAATTSAYDVEIEVLTSMCGDNTLDAGEECDDGNTIDGDGCSSACRIEGDTCADPISVTGDVTLSGDTRNFTNDYTNTSTYNGCTTSGVQNAADVAYKVTLLAGQTLDVSLSLPGSRWDAHIAITSDCASAAACIVHGDDPEEATYTNTTGATQDVFLLVDGWGSGEGLYDLTFTFTP